MPSGNCCPHPLRTRRKSRFRQKISATVQPSRRILGTGSGRTAAKLRYAMRPPRAMSTNVLTPAVAADATGLPRRMRPSSRPTTLPLRRFLLDSVAMEIPIGEYRLREWRSGDEAAPAKHANNRNTRPDFEDPVSQPVRGNLTAASEDAMELQSRRGLSRSQPQRRLHDLPAQRRGAAEHRHERPLRGRRRLHDDGRPRQAPQPRSRPALLAAGVARRLAAVPGARGQRDGAVAGQHASRGATSRLSRRLSRSQRQGAPQLG